MTVLRIRAVMTVLRIRAVVVDYIIILYIIILKEKKIKKILYFFKEGNYNLGTPNERIR